MRKLRYIALLLCATLALSGCFKEEKQGTLMRIALWQQESSDAEITKASSGIESYAFHVAKGTKWEVKSWEDALERKITNKERPAEVLTEPEAIGTFDAEAEYQIALDLWSTHTFIVVVDTENRVYATRLYDTPMNLPEVFTQLHIYAWRKTGTANGWDVVNPFYEANN